MKPFVIIAAMLLPAGLCLAQSDSAKTDSVKVTVETQNDDAGSSTVTVTTEKGAADSTITVSINSGQRRDQRSRRRMSWVVGVKASSLSYLPGSLFLQKRIGSRVLMGCALEYNRNPYVGIPEIEDGNNDYAYEYYQRSNSYSSWSVRLAPEFLLPIVRHRQYRMLTGVALGLEYGRARGSRTEMTYYPWSDTSWVAVSGQGKVNRYAASLPLVIERDFRIRKYMFSVGIESYLASFTYEKQVGESDVVSRSETSPAETSHRRSSYTSPARVSLRNPFQNTVSLLIKWYL